MKSSPLTVSTTIVNPITISTDPKTLGTIMLPPSERSLSYGRRSLSRFHLNGNKKPDKPRAKTPNAINYCFVARSIATLADPGILFVPFIGPAGEAL